MKRYKLRDYSRQDFANKEIFREEKCGVCGHCIPKDQSMCIRGVWVHNNINICIALKENEVDKNNR